MIIARWVVFTLLVCTLCNAQDTQFLPEIDTHFRFSSSVRLFFQAKDDREGDDPQQFTFGPSIQLYFKPLLKLKDVTTFDLDDVKSEWCSSRVGTESLQLPTRLQKIAH
jgi:hypothetical protein